MIKELVCEAIAVDKPTSSGRVYTAEAVSVMREQITALCGQGKCLVYARIFDGSPRLSEAVGEVTRCVTREGRLVFLIRSFVWVRIPDDVRPLPVVVAKVFHNGVVDPKTLTVKYIALVNNAATPPSGSMDDGKEQMDVARRQTHAGAETGDSGST